MYERGTVTAVDKDFITIICSKSDNCKTCPAGKLFCKTEAREFKALNTDNIDISVGNSVEIYLPPSKTIGYSFSVLIFPLLMFLAGYFLTAKLTNAVSEGIQVLGGFAGLVAGFATAFLYNSLTKKHQYPVITKNFDFDEE